MNATVAGAFSFDSGSLTDSLFGGAGNDVLSGGDGGDVLVGGGGTDWASYVSAPETVGVTLSLTTVGTGGHAAGDTFVSIENVQGSHGHDSLAGNSVSNEIRGMRGNDSILGYTGNDTLSGQEGRDTLDGGLGSDVLTGGDAEDCFVFSAQSLLSSDTITDFQINHDEIWLSAATFRNIGAIGALSAQSFALESAAGDVSDRIIYDPATGVLIFDYNGSRTGGGVQFAQLSTGLSLTETDFVIVA